MCSEEGFGYDAIKSLRRRWLITKSLIEYNDSVVVDSYQDLELSTEIEKMALKTVYEEANPSLPRSINNSAAAEIGRDFAEELIKAKLEGFAVVVLKECLRIQSLEVTNRISIIARVAEIQLFVHDLLYSKIGTHSLTHSLTYSLTHSPTHLLTYSLSCAAATQQRQASQVNSNENSNARSE
jgi:hypothetical protein